MKSDELKKKAEKLKSASVTYHQDIEMLKKELADTIVQYREALKQEKLNEIRKDLLNSHA